MDVLSLALSAACLFQAVFFIAVLASGQAREVVWGQLLIALLVAISLEKADQLYLTSGLYQIAPQLALIGSVFGAAVPGLIYLHLRARTTPEQALSWRDSYVLSPVVLLALYTVTSFHILPIEQKQALFETRDILNPVNQYIIPLTGDLIWIGFLIRCIGTIHRHDQRLLDWFSNLEYRHLSDVRTVLFIMCGLILLHALWTLTGSSGLGVALLTGHFLLINVLGLAALRRAPDSPQPAPTSRTSAPAQALEPVWLKVQRRLADEALYLDPDLTVAKLARAVLEPPRSVSEAINRYSGGSFYDLINAQRIDAAKARLAEDKELAILEIAYASGFNSKSAFNTAFKRITGMTPSAWRAEQNAF